MAQIKLNKQQQQLLIATLLMVGAFGYIYIAFFWLPISDKISDTQKQMDEVEAKIDKAQQQAGRKDKLEKELLRLSDAAVEAERRLPKDKDVPNILVTVSDLAARYHVQLISFSPGGSVNKQYFIELDYPVSVKGSYHNIGKFLAALALEERIFNVQNVAYAEPSSGVMTVTFTLISYQYKG